MHVEFTSDELRRLYEDVSYKPSRFGNDVVKAYRKKVGLLVAANDERDLININSLHYKKLVGNRAGQHSIRLNNQWRLILNVITADDDKTMLILEIVDYH